MPELPEVETIARQLRSDVAKRELRNFLVFDDKLNTRKLKVVVGHKVLDVKRSGKQVVICFGRGANLSLFLAVHLRMSGRLIWCKFTVLRERTNQRQVFKTLVEVGGYDVGSFKHVRAALLFDKGLLAFVDPRRFGTLQVSSSEVDFAPVGVEPLSHEFNFKFLLSTLKKSPQPLKHWLLRQDKIVGLGNIYVSEILYESGLSPMRSANSLCDEEVRLLHRNTLSILRKAIKHCGTTFSDFQDSRGVSGAYQKYLKVYNREGEGCFKCGTAVSRVVQQGRSTFYCIACQN